MAQGTIRDHRHDGRPTAALIPNAQLKSMTTAAIGSVLTHKDRLNADLLRSSRGDWGRCITSRSRRAHNVIVCWPRESTRRHIDARQCVATREAEAAAASASWVLLSRRRGTGGGGLKQRRVVQPGLIAVLFCFGVADKRCAGRGFVATMEAFRCDASPDVR